MIVISSVILALFVLFFKTIILLNSITILFYIYIYLKNSPTIVFVVYLHDIFVYRTCLDTFEKHKQVKLSDCIWWNCQKRNKCNLKIISATCILWTAHSYITHTRGSTQQSTQLIVGLCGIVWSKTLLSRKQQNF